MSPYIHEATKSYIVTFNSMGGTDIPPVKLYRGSIGGWVNFPVPTSGYGTFAGWYLDEDRNEPFTVFTYEDEVKLYAKWDAYYEIGDPGPGGGIIFYRKEFGFDVEGYTHPNIPGYSGNFPKYKAYYLEAAPRNISFVIWKGSATGDNIVPEITTSEDENADAILASSMGKGRKDTQIIIAFYADAVSNDVHTEVVNDTAANRASEYKVTPESVYNDWFLPSIGEIFWLYENRNDVGMGSFTNRLSSSSQKYNGPVYVQNFSSGDQDATARRNSDLVYPIRAF